jgi:hypothetical protein
MWDAEGLQVLLTDREAYDERVGAPLDVLHAEEAVQAGNLGHTKSL